MRNDDAILKGVLEGAMREAGATPSMMDVVKRPPNPMPPSGGLMRELKEMEAGGA